MPASPEAVVDQVISTATGAAGLWAGAADIAAWKAVTAAEGNSAVQPPALSYALSAVEPGVPNVENTITTYEAQRDFLVQLMTDKPTEFFTIYYPLNTDGYDEGMDWLINTITNGGTGINPAVEQQIWQRGRDRLIAEGARADSQTMLQFAQRGFSLPSGAMTKLLQANRFEQLQKLQEQSRDVAIRQAELEVENLRFAVDKVVTARLQAIAAAADYIRAITNGFDSAVNIANQEAQAKAALMAATADLYRARLQRDELAMRVPFQISDNTLKTNEINLNAFYQGIDAKVRGAGAAAQVYGAMAQAALSSLVGIGTTTISAAT